MRALIDRTGMRYGRLTVIKRAEDYVSPEGRKQVMWECLCDCGNTKNVSSPNLTSGHTVSCGCARKDGCSKDDFPQPENKYNPHSLANICFDCKKSTGHCSWSEVDPDTGQLRFEVPEGCVTKPCVRRINHPKKGQSKYTNDFQIISCPLFEEG